MWWDICDLVSGWEKREKREAMHVIGQLHVRIPANLSVFVFEIPEFGHPDSFIDRYRSPLDCKSDRCVRPNIYRYFMGLPW